jgi:hypothetical protein
LEHVAELLPMPHNGGFAYGNNAAIARARELDPDLAAVVLLNPDAVVRPGGLGKLMQQVNSQPHAGIVGAAIEVPGGELVVGARDAFAARRARSLGRLCHEQVIAGEDSEFGVRVALAGFKVTKIAVEMATHDADIQRFTQWWRRAVRGGHAIGQRFSLHGRGAMRDCARERRSVLVWGLALPATMLALAPATHGLSLLLAGGYVVLGQRIARYRRGLGDSNAEARLYARFVVIGKFAEAWGLLRFYVNNMAGRFRVIEYK